MSLTSEPTYSIVLFGGLDGNILWKKDFSSEIVSVGLGHIIDRKKGADVLIYTASNPWNVSFDHPYFGLDFELIVLRGSDGTELWTRSGLFPMYTEQIRSNGRDLLLIAGNYGYGAGQELCVLDLDSMSFKSTHINLPVSFCPFVLDNLSDGDDIVIVEGDAAIEAYRLRDWELVWEFDYYDNQIYFSDGWMGLVAVGDGRVAFQARKNETFNAIIVLDARKGKELSVIDPADTGLTLHHMINCGFFNDDGIADYLIYGYNSALEPTLCVMDGKTGSVSWTGPAHFSLYDSEPLTVRLGDTDADGLHDIFIIAESNLTIISGIDGNITWAESLSHDPEHLLTSERMESGKLNIAYVNDGTLYAMSLSYEVADEGFPMIYMVLLVVAIIAAIATLMLLKIKRQKPGQADDKPPENAGPKVPPT